MEIRKTEIFAKILDIVANETELTSEQILSCCRTAETVDARYILVHLLRREGMYISEIARMMNFSRRGIEKMLSQFEDRLSQSGHIFKVTFERIANKVRIAFESSR